MNSIARNTSHRGFTLLELLVVMVIIGLLASYVGPRFFEQVGKSETKATRAQIDAFGKALDTYRLDVGHYPTTQQGLRALIEKPANEAKWSGPYLQKDVPTDPWGQSYQYKVPGANQRQPGREQKPLHVRLDSAGQTASIGSCSIGPLLSPHS